MSEVPIYPPVDAGVEFFSIDSIINSQSEILLRLRRCAGGTDEQYRKFYFEIVQNLASYIQLLPASKSSTHSGAGGLLKLCLEMGLYSLQSAGGLTFASQAPLEIRRELEPRWRYTTFLAGLCSELYRIVSEMVVTDANGNVWPKYMTSLTKWGDENQLDRYYIQWFQHKNLQTMVSGRSDVSLIMTSIIPDYCFQYLGDFGTDMIPELIAVASNSKHPSESRVAQLVADTRKKVFARDEATKKERYGQNLVGNHLEPYLLDAMRTLVSQKKWLINFPKSRLWFVKEGLFLIWKNGSKEIIEVLVAQGVQGIPNESTTLAEILCQAKICERNGNQLYRMMKPQDADDFYQVIKISNPLSILESIDFEPASAEFATEITEIKIAATNSPQKNSPVQKVETKPTQPEPLKPPIDSNLDLFGFDNSSDQATIPADMEGFVLAEETDSITQEDLDKIQSENFSQAIASDKKNDLEKKPKASRASSKKNETSIEERPAISATNTDESNDSAEIKPPVKSKEISEYAKLLTEGARKSLKPEIAEVIGKMIDDFQKGRAKKSIFITPNGIAFDLPQLQRYGIAMDKLMMQFHSNGWLVTPPENPEKKIIPVQNPDGNKVTCIVIKTKGAQFLGFIENEA